MSDLRYLSGYGNYFETESIPGALPVGRNNPQKAPLGLYAEQISGSAFTALPHENLRTWFYRILPSVVQSDFESAPAGNWVTASFVDPAPTPGQLRWDPFPVATQPHDFVEGIVTIAGNGSPSSRSGSAVHIYTANKPMERRCIYNSDGDMLIVPQQGSLRINTECGRLDVEPSEIAIIPRGIKFQVIPAAGGVRGYICENFGEHFVLPYRGPIGANGLANTRDFLVPAAWYEDSRGSWEQLTRFGGGLWKASLDHSPFDVVAWHGNYAPCKYDLRRFNTMNTVSFDHPDPSIFTVLTSPSDHAGTANVDFVIFPPRWMVGEDTFRPPYYHRNIMSEYMGLIHGVYDAKPAGGFVPGGGSLHNCMSSHGPDAGAFEAASNEALQPRYLGQTLAFMFESSKVYAPTRLAMQTRTLQKDYVRSAWSGLRRHFKPD